MADLESLIQLCGDREHFLIRTVKYPELFQDGLIELRDQIIGLKSLKNDIAGRLIKLMMDTYRTGQRKMEMVNTLLYGPPGVGKTSISIILAKIWYAMGYLKGSPTSPPVAKTNPLTGDSSRSLWNSLIAGLIANSDLLLPSFGGRSGRHEGTTSAPSEEGSTQGQEKGKESTWKWWKLCLCGLVVVLLVLAGYWIYKAFQPPPPPKISNGRDIPASSLYRVVTRSDFVAEFVGQTETKTRALLNACRGKVLIVDEAYSLVSGQSESYGKIALTEINVFMTTYPEEIVFIFCGYKEKMLSTIFKAQEGLISRFNLTFDCSGYTPAELYRIFLHQAQQKKWTFRQPKKIRQMFLLTSPLYKAFARDTNKLLEFICTEHDRELVFTKPQPTHLGVASSSQLTPAHFRKGVEKFVQHMIVPSPTPAHPFSELFT